MDVRYDRNRPLCGNAYLHKIVWHDILVAEQVHEYLLLVSHTALTAVYSFCVMARSYCSSASFFIVAATRPSREETINIKTPRGTRMSVKQSYTSNQLCFKLLQPLRKISNHTFVEHNKSRSHTLVPGGGAFGREGEGILLIIPPKTK